MKDSPVVNLHGHVVDDRLAVKDNVAIDPGSIDLLNGECVARKNCSERLSDALTRISARVEAWSIGVKRLPYGCPPAFVMVSCWLCDNPC